MLLMLSELSQREAKMHKWHDILEVNGKLKLVHVVSDWR